MGNCGSAAPKRSAGAAVGGPSVGPRRFDGPHDDMATSACASLRPGEWVSCDDAGGVAIVDWEAGAVMQRWAGHAKSVTRVVTAGWLDGLATASRDGTIRLWRCGGGRTSLLRTDAPAATLSGHELTVSTSRNPHVCVRELDRSLTAPLGV